MIWGSMLKGTEMETDPELLELAAKAAGIHVIRNRLDDPLCRDLLVGNSARNPGQKAGPWNPCDDDGDALRLAVKLRLDIISSVGGAEIDLCSGSIDNPFGETLASEYGEDLFCATRRAIVRAAAEIGRAMP